jgi:hypothetical protein
VVKRTLATFRSAELGFFGVDVYTRVQTPRFWGAPLSAGVFVFFLTRVRPFLMSWLMVGIVYPCAPRFSVNKTIANFSTAQKAKKYTSTAEMSSLLLFHESIFFQENRLLAAISILLIGVDCHIPV